MTTQNTVKIPIIDVSPLLSVGGNKSETIEQITQALRTTGFFYIKNHGVVDINDEKSFMNDLQRFFLLEDSEKKKLGRSASSVGYTSIGKENTDDTQPNIVDYKEAFDFCVHEPHPLYGTNQWPEEKVLPGWSAKLRNLSKRLEAIGNEILKVFAIALGEDENFFAQWYTPGSSVLRLLRYPTTPSGSYIGCGAHTDYGLLTLLFQDDVGGLQVFLQGEWIDVTPIPGTLVINVGDVMSYLSSGKFSATKHRVKKNDKGVDRNSVVMFHEPNLNMPILLKNDSSSTTPKMETAIPTKYTPVPGTFGFHLQSRLSSTYSV